VFISFKEFLSLHSEFITGFSQGQYGVQARGSKERRERENSESLGFVFRKRLSGKLFKGKGI